MCTTSELLNNEAANTGCALNAALVWSSTECSEGGDSAGHVVVYGSTTGGPESTCVAVGDDAQYPVRCCADAHITESRKLRGRLGHLRGADKSPVQERSGAQ